MYTPSRKLHVDLVLKSKLYCNSHDVLPLRKIHIIQLLFLINYEKKQTVYWLKLERYPFFLKKKLVLVVPSVATIMHHTQLPIASIIFNNHEVKSFSLSMVQKTGILTAIVIITALRTCAVKLF